MNIKDSGTRREFDTGAVRDMAEGKGRCDLLPACAIIRLEKWMLTSTVAYDKPNDYSALLCMMKYLNGNIDNDYLAYSAWNILGTMFEEDKQIEYTHDILIPSCSLLRLSKLYESGAKKYGDRNWEKGINVSVMIDSAIRHLLKYLDGQIDEDHLCMAAWNVLGAMWMEEKKPELQDISSRQKLEV